MNDDASVTPVSGLINNQQTGASLAIDRSGDIWQTVGPQVAEVDGTALWSVGRAGASYSGNDFGYSGDGGPAQSARYSVEQVAAAPNGDFYLLEGDRVRKLTGMSPPSAPQIAGIVNAFTYQPGPLAPGELVTIFGSNFGVAGLTTYQLENNHVPMVLGRVKVLVNGFPGAITAVSPTQINVFVPYTAVTPQAGSLNVVAPGSTVTVGVQVDASGSSVTLPMVTTAPGLATADASGSGPGAVLNQDGTINSSANPANAGSIVSLFGTGAGWSSPNLFQGALTISTPYPTPLQNVAVIMGGQPASVVYAGAAPFLPAGIWQINARIPIGVGSGTVAVDVTIGGVNTGQHVTIAVK